MVTHTALTATHKHIKEVAGISSLFNANAIVLSSLLEDAPNEGFCCGSTQSARTAYCRTRVSRRRRKSLTSHSI